MKYKVNFILLFLFGIGFWSCKQNSEPKFAENKLFELAPPRVVIDSTIFKNSTVITAYFEVDGAKIRYTTDGGNVEKSSTIYKGPLEVNETGNYNFKVFHPDYQPSKQISTKVVKINQSISDALIITSPQPHANYKGTGINSLTDLKKGSTQFRNGSYWLGFLSPTTTIQLNLKKELPISKIVLSTLKDHNSWIFSPKSIAVTSNSKHIGDLKLESPDSAQLTQLEFIEIPLEQGVYSEINLQLTMENIPEWHQGKGTIPFFFIDEILVE
ncbi:chitobiase/beta-hexosaminidase C-terminal domain-containing protein [uncultured Croceitalea sp.]|uniref:chitobiase/beta-hexosaminidase C-terminal domain-containing protein n=1 Tax=uncultured Croceitalea sp. TaxID=1798908 RepID=UPI0033065351